MWECVECVADFDDSEVAITCDGHCEGLLCGPCADALDKREDGRVLCWYCESQEC